MVPVVDTQRILDYLLRLPRSEALPYLDGLRTFFSMLAAGFLNEEWGYDVDSDIDMSGSILTCRTFPRDINITARICGSSIFPASYSSGHQANLRLSDSTYERKIMVTPYEINTWVDLMDNYKNSSIHSMAVKFLDYTHNDLRMVFSYILKSFNTEPGKPIQMTITGIDETDPNPYYHQDKGGEDGPGIVRYENGVWSAHHSSREWEAPLRNCTRSTYDYLRNRFIDLCPSTISDLVQTTTHKITATLSEFIISEHSKTDGVTTMQQDVPHATLGNFTSTHTTSNYANSDHYNPIMYYIGAVSSILLGLVIAAAVAYKICTCVFDRRAVSYGVRYRRTPSSSATSGTATYLVTDDYTLVNPSSSEMCDVTVQTPLNIPGAPSAQGYPTNGLYDEIPDITYLSMNGSTNSIDNEIAGVTTDDMGTTADSSVPNSTVTAVESEYCRAEEQWTLCFNS